MNAWILRRVVLAQCVVAFSFAHVAMGQQMVQRGPFGKPAQVLDELSGWTTPLEMAANADVAIYIPDVTSTDWLKHNYDTYQSRGTYVLTMYTLYRNPQACRVNQMNWGLGDAAHLRACDLEIGYRVRRALVDRASKSVTLQLAGMLDKNGNLNGSSVQDKGVFRTWDQLDANTQKALVKADALVAAQMKLYDDRMRNPR